MSTVAMMYKIGDYTDDQIFMSVMYARRKVGGKDKPASYWERTLSRAKSTTGMDKFDVDIDEYTVELLLKDMTEILGVEVTEINKEMTQDNFHFNVSVRDTQGKLNSFKIPLQSSFKVKAWFNKICAPCGIAEMPDASSWNMFLSKRLVRMIPQLGFGRWVDIQWNMLGTYLAECNPFFPIEEKAPSITKDDKTLVINLYHLLRWISLNLRINEPYDELASSLSKLGFIKVKGELDFTLSILDSDHLTIIITKLQEDDERMEAN